MCQHFTVPTGQTVKPFGSHDVQDTFGFWFVGSDAAVFNPTWKREKNPTFQAFEKFSHGNRAVFVDFFLRSQREEKGRQQNQQEEISIGSPMENKKLCC